MMLGGEKKLDWREDLKATFDEFLERKALITKSLGEVLNEIYVSPYGIKSEKTEIGRTGWEIALSFPKSTEKIKFLITFDELKAGYKTKVNGETKLQSPETEEEIKDFFREKILQKVKMELAL